VGALRPSHSDTGLDATIAIQMPGIQRAQETRTVLSRSRYNKPTITQAQIRLASDEFIQARLSTCLCCCEESSGIEEVAVQQFHREKPVNRRRIIALAFEMAFDNGLRGLFL
jgi:hypothetical protein